MCFSIPEVVFRDTLKHSSTTGFSASNVVGISITYFPTLNNMSCSVIVLIRVNC